MTLPAAKLAINTSGDRLGAHGQWVGLGLLRYEWRHRRRGLRAGQDVRRVREFRYLTCGSAEVTAVGEPGLPNGLPLPAPKLGGCRARHSSWMAVFERGGSDVAALDGTTGRGATL